MIGIETQLGRYNTIGKLELVPGPTAGSLLGSIVVVFIARNGDHLVGIQFTDGTIASNTGRFVRNRPA
jgi:hypothetical protein